MPSDYEGVNVRTLTDDERYISTARKELPLVIEPKSASDFAFLQEFLKTHSSVILKDIARVGAVLLRGFGVRTDTDFEKAVSSVDGLQGIPDAFMSEAGRTLVEGTEFVLYTNSIYKTGGTLAFGAFHTENYFSPDVPRYICFCCLEPPRLGGETGMVHMPSVYGELDAGLQKRLEARSFRAMTWPLKAVAERYSMSPEKIVKFCADEGLSLDRFGDQQVIHLYKPSVLEHSATKQVTLALNLKAIPGQAETLENRFAPDYAGLRWLGWQIARRYPLLVDLSRSYTPAKTLKEARQRRQNAQGSQGGAPPPDKVGSAFNSQDVTCLVKSMRKNFASFAWKRGDILLLDNLQMAHAGMPGLGPRLVRALVCNPVPMRYGPGIPGRYRYTDADPEHQTLLTRLMHS